MTTVIQMAWPETGMNPNVGCFVVSADKLVQPVRLELSRTS
jgi:hypothetical protein